MARGPVFALTAEATLRSELKAGRLRPVYFFYGDEDFLTRTYVDMLINAAGAREGDGLNLLKLRGVPDLDRLSDFLESVPFFAPNKVAVITDLDPEDIPVDIFESKTVKGTKSRSLLWLIENITETSVLVFAETSQPIDDMKPKAKTKKLISAVEKCGAVCRFPLMSVNAAAGMAAKKAAKSGCTISPQDAAFLAERCGCSLTLLQTEVEKLCTYRQSGTITREDISALVPRTLDASAYDLSELLFQGNCGAALSMLDDLYQQRVEPVLILAAVSGAFVDCFRGKLAVKAGKSSQQAAADFGCFGGRAFYFGKACTRARGLSDGYLNGCMDILFRTNRLMNSSKTDTRILLERAFTEISALKGARV